MKIAKRILLSLLLVFIVMQFFRPDRSVEAAPAREDIFYNLEESEAQNLIRAACYDCHSNETVWPWYGYVAPVSLILAHHVEDGRQQVNFSEWDKPQHAEDLIEVIQEGEMPLTSYLPAHPEARLSTAEKQALIEGLRATIANDPPVDDGHGHDH